MSVTHNKNGGGNAALKKEVEAVKAAEANNAALLSLSFKAQIVQDRAANTKARLPQRSSSKSECGLWLP